MTMALHDSDPQHDVQQETGTRRDSHERVVQHGDLKIIYPSPVKNGIIRSPHQVTPGLGIDKLGWAAQLPFAPSLTQTLLDLKKFEDLDVENLRRYVYGLILDLQGTILPEGGSEIAPAVVEKLREIRTKMKDVCVFPDDGVEHTVFHELKIPVVKNAAPKPYREGFERASYYYLNKKPKECAIVGDNMLTDGAARQTGMRVVLVDPLPGKEGFLYKLGRGYGRAVKKMHDKMYGRKN